MNSKEPITLIGSIPADTKEVFRHTFEQSGAITGAKISTYVGHEFGLQYVLELHPNDGSARNLTQPLDQSFIAGNGENFDLPVRQEFKKGDTLVVTVQNTASPSEGYEYHYNAQIHADYQGGTAGIFSEIFG